MSGARRGEAARDLGGRKSYRKKALQVIVAMVLPKCCPID